MMGNARFTIWAHRRGGSIFGDTSRPVNRDGLTLSFSEEQHTRAECDRLNASTGDFYTRYTVEKETVAQHQVSHSDLERRIAEFNLFRSC